ncbi:MAG: D-ribose pyranase [Trueperaceae bacterium]|nr:MAG: D-ribose pyranase [Trueperaceae bacterium]
MKKTGLLHAELSRTIASMGHGDILVIGDAGLPVPPGVPLIDLALRTGVPGFLETLEIVLSELHVERAVIDEEMASVSPAMSAAFHAAWPSDVALHSVPHAELQATATRAKALVRTGECTPYSNIVLVSGVVF